MKKGYKIFSHTADVGLRIQGKTRAKLLKNAAEGMLALLTHSEKFNSKSKVCFVLSSRDWESLLVDWLHEILYYFTVKKMGFSRFRIERIGPFFLKASGYGEKIDLKRHQILREVKAVTYHNLRIKKAKGCYSTRIIFDI